jgi:hypothetical protein
VPLVAAMREYQAQNGHPPKNPEMLVPEFLAVVPQTGVGCHSSFRLGPWMGPPSPDGWSLEVWVPHAPGPFPTLVYWPGGHYPASVGLPPHVEGWLRPVQNGWALFQPND